MPENLENRAIGSSSHPRKQQRSNRSHQDSTLRRPNPSSSRVSRRPNRHRVPAIHDDGNIRQAIGAREGSGNDIAHTNDDVRQQATVRPFDGARGYHDRDGEPQLRPGPSHPWPYSPEAPQQTFETMEPAKGKSNMANGHAGHYFEEVGSPLSMLSGQGSASINSNTTAPEPADTHVGWYPDVQRQFMHGQSPWSTFEVGVGSPGVGTIEGRVLMQTIYPLELSVDEDESTQVR